MFFDEFVSNTLVGSSNQHFFISDGKTQKGRVFYKVFEKGQYNYSFLFTNTIDSTYGDGSISHKNLVCESWKIEKLRIACCDEIDNDIPENDFKIVTFSGEKTKVVNEAEIFSTDPILISPKEYICLEITFRENMIPYHEEIIVSTFTENDGNWVLNQKMPVPAMIGCDRKAEKRIGFLGDSITQGCGTPLDSYSHWNAVLAEKLGNKYAYWNLGIGYGRASDAATDGAWLNKAKNNDIVFVCFGVNDILHGGNGAEQICADINTIVEKLKEAGVAVILQTVPPFDYKKEDIEKWQRINRYIKTELIKKVDFVFDNNPILRKNEKEAHIALYGGHPNSEGCKKWAEALYDGLIRNEVF